MQSIDEAIADKLRLEVGRIVQKRRELHAEIDKLGDELFILVNQINCQHEWVAECTNLQVNIDRCPKCDATYVY